MALQAFLPQVVIPAALQLTYTDDDMVGRTADLDAGTYTTMHDVAVNLAANMNVATGAEIIAVTIGTTTTGITRFASTGSRFEIDWNADAGTVALAQLFGFDNSADDIGATVYNGDFQHKNGWYPTRIFAKDSKDRRHRVGGETRKTLSRKKNKRLFVATGFTRVFEWELAETSYIFEADAITAAPAGSSSANTDFETQLWLPCSAKGLFLTYYPDAGDTGTSTVYYFDGLPDMAELVRPHIDLDRYNIVIPLIRQES